MKDFPGQRLFPGSRSSRLKVCSRFTVKEDEVSLLLLAGDLICCCSHPACLRLPVLGEQHHQHFIPGRLFSGLPERSGCWKGPRVGSILVSVIYGKRGSSRGHCKTWQQGKMRAFTGQGASRPREPAPLSHLGSKAPHRGGYNASILPSANASRMWAGAASGCTSAGLWHEEEDGQLTDIKIKQKQTKKPRPKQQQQKKISPRQYKHCPRSPWLPFSFWQWKKKSLAPAPCAFGGCSGKGTGRDDALRAVLRLGSLPPALPFKGHIHKAPRQGHTESSLPRCWRASV